VGVAGRKITKYDVGLLAIILLGLFLRVYHLQTQSIWFDEAFSVFESKMSLPQLVETVARVENSPPLYFVLLHYWMMIFGTSESAVRFLSALFGVLAIPVIYLVGRQLFNEEVGLLSALILAISSFNIWYSQETRMYTLMVLLVLLSMYCLLRLLQHSTLAWSAGYVLSTALLVYTHFYGLFVLLAQNIYIMSLVLSKNRTFKLRHWIVLQATVLALLIPWVVVSNQISRRLGTTVSLTVPTTADFIYTFSVYSGTAVLLVLFLVLSVLSLFGYQKVRGKMDWKAPLKALERYSWEVHLQNISPVYFLSVWLLTINLIPFIISRFSSSIYLERYTIAASVALYLLVAKGIHSINYRYAKIVVIGLVAVLSVANLSVYYTSITKPQAREAISYIDANLKSGDVVLVSHGQNVVFDYYNKRTDAVVNPLHSWAVVGNATNSTATPSVKDKINEIQSDVSGHDRVWLFATNFITGKAAENFTLSILNESYANIYTKTYLGASSGSTAYGYDVYLFEKRTLL